MNAEQSVYHKLINSIMKNKNILWNYVLKTLNSTGYFYFGVRGLKNGVYLQSLLFL